MYSDIVFPDSNEKDFVEVAEALGYSRLIFAYKSEKDAKSADVRIRNLGKGIEIKKAVLVDNPNKKIEGKVAFVKSSDRDREFIERANIDLIYGLENSKRDDFMHHRNSGFNHVLAKLAHEKNVAVAFSFSLLLNSDTKRRAVIFGRISQNIRLCQKYSVRMIIASFAKDPYGMRAPKDLRELFLIAGMNQNLVKKAQYF